MQVNSVQNYSQNNQYTKNLGFKGELGKRIVENLYEVPELKGDLISLRLHRKFKLCRFGFLSESKFIDILEEVSAKFKSNKDTISTILRANDNEKMDIANKSARLKMREIDVSKEEEELEKRKTRLDNEAARLNRLSDELSQKKKSLDETSENINNDFAKRNRDFTKKEEEAAKLHENKLQALRKREQEINETANKRTSEIDAREQALEEREKHIEAEVREKTTAAIHEEEMKNAQNALEEKSAALDRREAELIEKENAFMNAEYLIKDAEKEKLMSEFRVIHNINDKNPKNFYNNVSEQILVLTDILDKEHTSHLEDFNSEDFVKILEAMRNKENVLSGEMLQYVERVIDLSHDWNIDELTDAIKIVKDNYGNIDSEKASSVVAFLLLPKSNLSIIIDKMFDVYKDIDLVRKLYTVEYNGTKIQLKRRDFDRYNDLVSQINEEEDRIKNIIDGDSRVSWIKYKMEQHGDANYTREYKEAYEEAYNKASVKSCKETISELQQEVKKLLHANIQSPEQLNSVLK